MNPKKGISAESMKMKQYFRSFSLGRPDRGFQFLRVGILRMSAFVLLFCLTGAYGQEQQNDQQQMRGLEEKLLYPSGTQVAVFVALSKGDGMRLDAVRLEIDGMPVAHYIYSAKELEALRKGGVQRVYVGNVTTGEHRLDVFVGGKLEDGGDFAPSEHFVFRKEVEPKLVELTLSGPRSGTSPITLGEW